MADPSDIAPGTEGSEKSTGLIEAEIEAIDELYNRVRSGDIYSVLGVSPDADIQYIRKVYYELSRSWHPDQFYRRDIGVYKQKLEDIFVGINRAYTILTDPRRRSDYDTEHGGEARADAKPAPRRPGSEEDDAGGTFQPGDDAVEHEVAFRTGKRVQREQAEATQQVLVTTPRRRRRRGRIPGMEKVHEQVMTRLGKARRHFRTAEREAAQGNFVAAASNAYLAMTFDPEDLRYRALWEECDPKGRTQLAQQHIQLAESAMSYHNIKAAVHNYQKACEAGPPNAEPYFQLANLMMQSDEDRDEREIMKLLRRAVELSPRKVQIRLALADFYQEQGLLANARREYDEVLRIEPGNSAAKAGIKRVRR
jgi:tetratricopeptide (TPR) repeat protein